MKRMPFSIWWAGWAAVRRFMLGVTVAIVVAAFDMVNRPPLWATAFVVGCALVGWTQIYLMVSVAWERVDRFGRSKQRGMDELVPALWTITEALDYASALTAARAEYGETARVEKHVEKIRSEISKFHETLLLLRSERRKPDISSQATDGRAFRDGQAPQPVAPQEHDRSIVERGHPTKREEAHKTPGEPVTSVVGPDSEAPSVQVAPSITRSERTLSPTKLGERLAALRVRSGLSMAEAADAIGHSVDYLAHLESGLEPASDETLEQLARTYHGSIEDIVHLKRKPL